MSRGGNTTLAVAIALLLIAGLAACGGGEDSAPTTTPSSANDRAGEDGTAGDGGGDGGNGGSTAPDRDDSDDRDPAEESAREHDDSGGGAEQFRVKGGDNSVQEFGSEASGTEFDQAAAVLHDFLDARVEGDWRAACTHLATDVAESLTQFGRNSEGPQGRGCPEILAALSEGVPRSALKTAAQADVGSLRVEGDRAFVLYRGAQKTVFAMPMKKEDGSWKVASLAGTPLT